MSKIIKKEYEVFSFEELSQEAKDKAREDYNNTDFTLDFLEDDLREYIHEELESAGLKELGENTTAHHSITVYYSLSYCQGDGLMFEGSFEDKKGNIFTVKHSGHYYHERSTNIVGVDQEGNEIDTTDFEEDIYIPICERVRDRGYTEIEFMGSEETFADTCEANEFTFLEDGRMFNE